MTTNGLDGLLAPFMEIADQLRTQNEMLGKLLAVTEKQGQTLAKMQVEAVTSRRIMDGIRTITGYPVMSEAREIFRSRQLGLLETIESIAANDLSVVRFGDGELRCIFRPGFNVSFQKNSPALALELRSALSAEGGANMLVGLPNVSTDLFWNVMFHELWDSIKPYVEQLPRFGNAHATRPIVFQSHGMDAVNAWRRVWESKEALIITGQGSRFELAPALFDNLAGHRFEYSTPQDAYADIDRIEQLALEAPEKLVIISLGPAGTVLGHRLAKAGKQALDIGHLSSSYVNVLEGGAFPERTPVVR